MVSANIKSVHQVNLERAEFLLYQALDADEAGRASEAVTLYSEAIELCLQSVGSFSWTQSSGEIALLF